MPPVEERVPAFTVTPPLSDKSAPPVIICSVAASSVNACETFSPAIWSFSVSAKSARSSVPTDNEVLPPTVEFAANRSVVELSGLTPLKSCVPSTSRILLLLRESALSFVVNVVFFVFSVAPVSDKAILQNQCCVRK